MDIRTQQKLKELFIIYTKNLPGKINNIEAQWQDLVHHWDTYKFENFHRDVHSLCGSAGTYGYMDLSKEARNLEIHLKSLLNEYKLTSDAQEKISVMMKNIRTISEQKLPLELLPFEQEKRQSVVNKRIYIVEQDAALAQELITDLAQTGYICTALADLEALKNAVLKAPSIAIIIDTEFLDEKGISNLQLIQSQLPIPILVFCIVPTADLYPRLQAIRAGGHAFFQKPVDIFELTKLINQKCSVMAESYRILIIDDSESLAEYYSLILTEVAMVTHTISNPMELLQALESFQPDLLLMDVYMPECTGLELAAVIRQESHYTKIPIIFLSTEDDKRKQLTAISLGGDDFLTKPVTPVHLISAVRSRAKRAGVLNYFMTTDSLTGLLNHSSLLKRLDIELNHAKQEKIPLTFIMIDIDHFKKVNDTYGHLIGDIVIKKLATLLLVRLRSQDIVGRYGGEEFAIILPGATSVQSKEICDALREQFSQIIFTANNVTFNVHFSAGISCFNTTASAPDIIEAADKALYKAKQLGRNQSIIHEEYSE